MEKITVIGAGTMGAGIAQVFAHRGHEVVLLDLSDERLAAGRASISHSLGRLVKKEKCSEQEKEATLSRIATLRSLPEALKEADLVVEAAVEDYEAKASIFKEADANLKPEAILASNTSSLSITRLAASTQRPDRVIGMHFMNPVPMMKLVEVICGYQTSQETTHRVLALAKGLDKVPIAVKDYPGFVANRILIPMINEAIYALYQHVGDVEAIDRIMELGMAHAMGPLRLADFIGLDVCLSILRVLHKGLGQERYAPCPLLVNMVLAGRLGVKTKEGFYIYEQGKAVGVAPGFDS